MTRESTGGKIITFYSYKGGTGRSMALANIAWIMAAAGKRVLVIDWDLEAPGLQRYFRPFLVDKELTSSDGIVDLINDFILEAITPLEKGEEPSSNDWYRPLLDLKPYLMSLNWRFSGVGKIDFIPAGRQGPDYAARFTSINWQKFYDVLGGGGFLEDLKEEMRPAYDYILVDSRTGVSDTSGICTVQMPDILVVCFTFNNQSILGASQITQSVYEQRLANSKLVTAASADSVSERVSWSGFKSPFGFQIVPAPMRVDESERDKLELRKVFSQSQFNSFIERIPERSAFWASVEVPYKSWFSYEEVLAPFRDNPSDPKSLLSAFVRLTSYITNNDVNQFVSLLEPEVNQRILDEFAGTSATAADESERVAASTESALEKQVRLAERVLQSLNQDEQVAARRLWTRLVRVPGRRERAENSKVQVPVNDLAEIDSNVIDRFVSAGLIVPDEDQGEPTLEVANEEILRNWKTLQLWIDDNREFLRWRQRLQTAVADWETGQMGRAGLLKYEALDEARHFSEGHATDLNNTERSFLEQSFSEDLLRRRRNVRVGAVALVVLLLSAVILISYFRKTSNSKRSDELYAEAAGVIKTWETGGGSEPLERFQLGLLLVVEADKLNSTSETQSLLTRYLPLLAQRNATIDEGNSVLKVAPINSTQVAAVIGRPRTSDVPSAEDRTAVLEDLGALKNLSRIKFQPGTRNFEVSPNGKYLALATDEAGKSVVRVSDIQTNRQMVEFQHARRVLDLTFSPDSRYLGSASGDRTMELVDLQGVDGKPSTLQMVAHSAPVNAITFSRDGQLVATAGEDFAVNIWSIRQGKQIAVSKVGTIQLVSTAFTILLSPTADYLATISLDNTRVNIWSVYRGQKILELNPGDPINAVAFDNAGRLVTGGSGGHIRVVEIADENKRGEVVMDISNKADPGIERLLFSPSGTYLASISGTMVRILNYEEVVRIRTTALIIQSRNIYDFAFATDDTAVTGGADNALSTWNLTGTLAKDLRTEACSRLTRNLTIDEWNQYMAASQGAYRRTCDNIP